MLATRLRRAASEPLLHFALLGAAVFGAWRWAAPPDDATPTLVVDRATVERIEQDLEARLGRAPTEPERQAAIDGHVDGELLYREGLALGLDRDDPMVRQRVIKKMEFVSTNLELPELPDEATLRQFMAENPQRYAGPPRFDFELITMATTTPSVESTRADAEEVLQQLRAGADPRSVGGRHSSGTRFTLADLGKTYGMELGGAVAALPPGEWGLVPFPGGVTLVHLLAQHPGDAPPFEKLRNRIQLDWKQSQRSTALRQRLDALRERYRIEVAAP